MTKNMKYGVVVSVFAVGFLALVGFSAAGQMHELQSQAGNTVAELFYNAFGLWAAALIGLGVIVAVASVVRLSVQSQQLRLAKKQQLLLMVTGTPPAWRSDPTDRHELRYWDGGCWTDAVSDQGVPGQDPV